MDTSRLSTADLIAGAGSIVLFLALFLDWVPDLSAWKGFDIIDIVLAALAVGVFALIAARAAGNPVAVPGPPGGATFLAGFTATIIVLTFLLEGDDVQVGLWLALVAALAITYGGWRAMKGPAASAPATPSSGSGTPPSTPAA